MHGDLWFHGRWLVFCYLLIAVLVLAGKIFLVNQGGLGLHCVLIFISPLLIVVVCTHTVFVLSQGHSLQALASFSFLFLQLPVTMSLHTWSMVYDASLRNEARFSVYPQLMFAISSVVSLLIFFSVGVLQQRQYAFQCCVTLCALVLDIYAVVTSWTELSPERTYGISYHDEVVFVCALLCTTIVACFSVRSLRSQSVRVSITPSPTWYGTSSGVAVGMV